MKTGVVMELKDGRAVVLDGSGGFRDIEARPEWRRGDVVRLPAPRRRSLLPVGLAACLAVVLAGTGGWLWLTPAALLSLDVNPSVELRVNRFEHVVSAQAMNDQGAALLDAGSVRWLPAGEAVAALLGSDYLEPYLETGDAVTFTVQAEDFELETRLLALVDETAADAVSAETRVSCHGVDEALVEEAHTHGVTAGKYLALLDLQAADPEIDISDYTHCGIGEIEAQTARCHDAAAPTAAAPDESCGDHPHHGSSHGG